MVTRYNQTGRPLLIDIGGGRYPVEAWGSVELPENIASLAVQQGTPIGEVEVPVKVRSARRSTELTDDKKAAEIDRLELRLVEAEELTLAAQKMAEQKTAEAEKAKVAMEKAESELAAYKADNAKLQRDLDEAIMEAAAAKADSGGGAKESELAARVVELEAKLDEAIMEAAAAKGKPGRKKKS